MSRNQTQLTPYGLGLAPEDKEALSKAMARHDGVVLRLEWFQLEGKDILDLTQRQIAQIAKSKFTLGEPRGVKLGISKNQLDRLAALRGPLATELQAKVRGYKLGPLRIDPVALTAGRVLAFRGPQLMIDALAEQETDSTDTGNTYGVDV